MVDHECVIWSIELLTSEIYGPRGSHTYDLWMLVDIDIIMRIFMKNPYTKYV